MHVLTRYLTLLYLTRFALLLFCIAAFILSLDLVTNADKVVENSDGDVFAVARYAALRLPQIVSDTIKYAGLFGALLTFMSLMRHNQLAPIWGGGISQFGIIRRLAPVVLAIGVLQFSVDEALVPGSNAALREWGVVEQDIAQKKDSKVATSATWLKVNNDIVRIPLGMAQKKTLHNFLIFQRNNEGHLVSRMDVSEAHRQGGKWILEGVTRRTLDATVTRIDRSEGWGAGFKPKDMDELTIHPRDLAFDRLWGFVTAKAHGTWAPRLYRTWLHVRIAACFIPLLMLFLVVALSQRFQRTGRTEFLFLVGLALGFVYFISDGIGLALGEVGLLPPVIAGWAATVGFAAIIGAIAFSREVHDTSARYTPIEAS